MSPLALVFLRRATAYALLLAVLIVTVPRALSYFGVLGPSLEEEIAGVERSLSAARSYGAGEGEPSLAGAQKALERARELAARKQRWQAKWAIAEARQGAIEAQRAALATRDDQRRAAQKTIANVDRLLNELEDLYADAVKVVDKQQQARLLSMMKSTRQRSAGLFLYYEEESYDKVLAGETEVKLGLASTRQELLAARQHGPFMRPSRPSS